MDESMTHNCENPRCNKPLPEDWGRYCDKYCVRTAYVCRNQETVRAGRNRYYQENKDRLKEARMAKARCKKPAYLSKQPPLPLDCIRHEPTDTRSWSERRAAIRAKMGVRRDTGTTFAYGLGDDKRVKHGHAF